MLKVAYLDHTAKWSGGEVALFNILTHLNQEIVPLVILGEEGELAERLRDNGIDVRVIPLDEKVRDRNRNALNKGTIGAALKLMAYGRKLAPLLKAENVSCIHTNSLKSALYGAVTAKLSSIPIIWHIRDHIDPPYMKSIVAKTIKLLSRLVPNGIIANSKSTLSVLNLPTSKRTLVVYSSYANAVEAKSYSPSEEKEFIVLLVGRLAPWKGQHILLEAAKSFISNPNVQFWLAGDALFGEDAYKHELLNQIETNQLTNVRLLGHIENIQELMRKADLLVHTSITPEPFGQVIVEGMAAGLPVIASNEGGPTETVVHNETGLLIKPRDPVVLRESIQWMLDHPDERMRMSEKATTRVKEHFVIEHTIKEITDYYGGLIIKT